MKMKIFLATVITVVSIGSAFAGPAKTDFNDITEVKQPVTVADKPIQQTQISTVKNNAATDTAPALLRDKASQDIKRNRAATVEETKERNAVMRALVRHLNDANPVVRREAFTALKKIGKPALPLLTVALKHNRNAIVRMQAAKLLGEIT